MAGQAVHWCFTSYKEELDIKRDQCAYFVYGYEKCPDTGRKHKQGYIKLKKKMRMAQVKTVLNDNSVHLEVKRGSVDEAIKYCMKDGTYIEYGERPKESSAAGAEKRKMQWKTAYDLAKQGKFEEIDEEMFIRYHKGLQAVHKMTLKPTLTTDGDFENEWIWGAPGVGKSREVFEKYPNAYRKAQNKWWDDYNGEEVVIIDDLHKDWTGKAALKNWADRYATRVETKGGTMLINPKKIIITSNYTIEECFADKDAEAIQRRFNVINKFII